MKKIKIIILIVLLLLFLWLLYRCANPGPSYVEEYGETIIIDGTKYVHFEVSNSYLTAVRIKGDWFKLYEKWTVFSDLVAYVDAPLPMIVSSSEFYIPETLYDEWRMFIENIEWGKTLEARESGYNGRVTILSEGLTEHLLSETVRQEEPTTYYEEWNDLDFFAVYQYDTTNTFKREIGIVWIRAQGDCYFFADGKARSQSMSHFYPEGEEYQKQTELYKDIQVPEAFWEELRNARAENIKNNLKKRKE